MQTYYIFFFGIIGNFLFWLNTIKNAIKIAPNAVPTIRPKYGLLFKKVRHSINEITIFNIVIENIKEYFN